MIPRRAILVAGIASIAMPAASPAQQGAPSLSAEDRRDIARAESHLDSLRTLAARFLQVSDRGAVAEGRLHLHRPGRLRLDYAPPSPLLIIAARGQIIQHDRELRQTSYILMSSTPLAVLLRERVELSGEVTPVAVERGPGVLRIAVVQASDPRAGSLTLVFSERPFRLAGWIVSDAQGATTRVTLSDMEAGATMDPGLFLFREEFPQGN